MNQYNKNVMINSTNNGLCPQQQTTTDALIINSNSTVVSDELILQLQEQFGDNKQIYILNTSNNSVSSSSSYNSSSNNNTNSIQYLIVDKDVDINAILQDPSIFQNQQQTVTNQPTHQISHQNQVSNSIQTKSQIQQPVSQNHHLLAEESIQRVTAPPPKRKQFEYKLDSNKRMSYQDAFLRFLAGEKQPTLEINTNEHANKKPKDNIYYNFYLNNPKLTPQNGNTPSPTSITNIPVSNSNPPVVVTNGNTVVFNSATNVPSSNNDKENYYNSSRRENLLPLNNYEYRNSYKDHYDNQGVRINPALFKNLPSYPSTSQTNAKIKTVDKIENAKIVTKSNEILDPKSQQIVIQSQSVNSTLNDHTYKTNQINDTKILQKELSQTDLETDLKRKSLNDDITIIDTEIKVKQTKADGAQEELNSNVNNFTETQSNLVKTNEILCDNITFSQGEFLIHKPTFSGDFDNYEIWCVLDEQYLQKYEPVLLSTGERCHQSADVLAQYTANKNEFLLVKVEEKGKTENNNIVVGVLHEYEPKNNPKMAASLLPSNQAPISNPNQIVNQNSTNEASNANVVVVTYDDLKSAFDVFVQVMSSQYLNGEFLLKIKEIQDEYFKPSIDFIETILNEKYNLLIGCMNNFIISINTKLKSLFGDGKNLVDLKEDFKYLLEHKPKLLIQKVTFDNVQIQKFKKCESLNYYYDYTNGTTNFDDSVINVSYLVQFSGNLYDSDTLVPLDGNGVNDKQFLVCTKICNFVNLLHSLKHFKISYLEICSQKIESIKIQLNSTNNLNTNPTDENNSNTDLLNYCLADSQWLLEMFEKFKQLLFDVDNLISGESSNESSQSDKQSKDDSIQQQTNGM